MAVPEDGLSMLPDDQFNIDSIAKMMTATIVMKLVEAKVLGVDDRNSQYLPDPSQLVGSFSYIKRRIIPPVADQSAVERKLRDLSKLGSDMQ